MFLKILKRDFLRNKSITIILFLFVMLAALLVSGGTALILKLTGSIEYMLHTADVPHYLQMNAGEINQKDIDEFVNGNRFVSKQQTVQMLNIDGAVIYLGDNKSPEANSVMDNGFVTQNEVFDYLLNQKNELLQIKEGEIAVPIYYMQKYHLKIGDKLRIDDGSFHKEFLISDFVRDAIMNPSITSSKRFVVNEKDLNLLKDNVGTAEYLIEFQLKDISKLKEFANDYQSGELPKKGPSIDYNAFILLNAVTDGIMAAVMILVSILLIVIAVLCLRFTMIAAIEEDYREIGVMKAIGISQGDTKRIYLIKYSVLSAAASLAGYLLSIPLSGLLTSNIALYMGLAPMNVQQFVLPLLGAVLIGLLIILCCVLILRRFRKISAVEALRSGSSAGMKQRSGIFKLYRRTQMDVNLFLGVKDILCRLRMYGLLLFIFLLSSFIIIVPVNILNTMKSPDFMSYMGVGRSELRIDLQQTDNTRQRFNDIIKYLKEDKDVEKFSALITCRYQMLGNEGIWEGINIETGDQSNFPLKYLEGNAPAKEGEIALSYLCAGNADKRVGDKLLLRTGGQQKEVTVCGIYQDITNGGITAKAMIDDNPDTALWYVVNINLIQGVSIQDKQTTYGNAFKPAKVTDPKGYVVQTLGETINQLKLITAASVIIAAAISILITSFFLKMLTAKDKSQIAVMKSIGFSQKDIRDQYITRMLLILISGIIMGTIAANTLGEVLVSAVMSGLGASKLEFVSEPLQTCLLYPLGFILIVIVTTLAGIKITKRADIRQLISE